MAYLEGCQLTITKRDQRFIVARVTIDCECFHSELHCFGLLFAKSTVN
jgi:hypothetical protein